MPIQIHMGASLIEGTTLNLSEHGMYMFTASNLSVGCDIEIVFRPPGEKQQVRVSATVRRKVVYLYGIEFLSKKTQPDESATDRSPKVTPYRSKGSAIPLDLSPAPPSTTDSIEKDS